MENMTPSYQGLENFNWESAPNDVDFFGINAEKYKEQVDLDKARNPKVELENEETPEEPEKTEEEQPIFESFMDIPKEEEDGKPKDKIEQNPKSPGRPPKTEPLNLVEQFNSFKEQGIIKHIDLEEDIESLDEDTFKELLYQDYEEEVNSRIEQWATQELDEDAQAFIKFKKNGGRTEDFFSTFSKVTSSNLSGNIEDEKFQDKVIRKQLAEEGDWDEEEIQDRLDHLARLGKKQSVAEKYYNKIKQAQQKEANNLLKRQEEYKQQVEQNKLQFRNTVKESLNKTQEVKGLKITAKDRATLYNFITKEDQVVGDRQVTGFQRAITEAVQDPEKMLLLAKLLATDFDMSEFEKKAKIQETKKIKENLESRKGFRPSTSSGGNLAGGKSLSDLWD